MYLQQIRIQDFASFEDTGPIDLDPYFNLFIGLNNSGKSAVLRSVFRQLPDNPHRNNSRFLPGDLRRPTVHYRLHATLQDILERFSRINQSPSFPAGDATNAHDGQIRLLQKLETDDDWVIEAVRRPNNPISSPDGGPVPDMRGQNSPVNLNVEMRDGAWHAVSRGQDPSLLPSLFEAPEAQSIFYFSPQRHNVSSYGLGEETTLLPDASNLPSVLAYLQGSRPNIFAQIEAIVSDLVPGVARLSVTPRGNQFVILLWPERVGDTAQSFTLADSGTGVGQVIAILTAVLTAHKSVIAIDEINTYLHPSAAKKLISILKNDFSQHQYLVSSHSPEVISQCADGANFLVRLDGYHSSIKRLDLHDINVAKNVAQMLGVSMMDVFGHERIVWVEGQTEEIAFPAMLRKLGKPIPPGLGFGAVHATDVFTGKRNRSDELTSLYEQAGRRLAPLLSGMAFILDRERLSDDAVLKHERSKRKLRFLKRRAFENYLLQPAAIARIISAQDNRRHDELAIVSALKKYAERNSPRHTWKNDVTHESWQTQVDAAGLLKDVFSEVSEARVEFRKTRDSVALGLDLSLTAPETLIELITSLDQVIEISQRDTAP